MTLHDKKGSAVKMDCQRVEDQLVIERYIAGRLPEQEAEVFEQHYLDCKRCFEELQLKHSATIELARRRAPLNSTLGVRSATPWRWIWVASSAMAAVLITAIYLWFPARIPQPSQTAQTTPDVSGALQQLASVEPYPYIPTTIRGGGGANPAALARFEEGMSAYVDGKFEGALGPLSEAARLEPENNPIAFYLGISFLMTNKPDDAIPLFSKLTSSQNPYSEDGHWYLAKAYLRKKDAAKAEAELETVEMLNNSNSGEAREILNRLGELGLRHR